MYSKRHLLILFIKQTNKCEFKIISKDVMREKYMPLEYGTLEHGKKLCLKILFDHFSYENEMFHICSKG